MPSPLALSAIDFARQELAKGVHQIPWTENAGPDVDKYLTAAGLSSPNEWCMSFVYWCFVQAGRADGTGPGQLIRTGNCWHQWEGCPQCQVQDPEVGDILIFKDEAGECTNQVSLSPILDGDVFPDLSKLALPRDSVSTISFEEHTFDLSQVFGHAGIVIDVHNGSVTTIEGNSGIHGKPYGSSYVASHNYPLAAYRCRPFGTGRRVIAGFLRIS